MEELSGRRTEKAPSTAEETQQEIAKYKSDFSMVERADAALPNMVEGLEQLDREMDEYADKAMDTFEDLVDLVKNVEDRHAVHYI